MFVKIVIFPRFQLLCLPYFLISSSRSLIENMFIFTKSLIYCPTQFTFRRPKSTHIIYIHSLVAKSLQMSTSRLHSFGKHITATTYEQLIVSSCEFLGTPLQLPLVKWIFVLSSCVAACRAYSVPAVSNTTNYSSRQGKVSPMLTTVFAFVIYTVVVLLLKKQLAACLLLTGKSALNIRQTNTSQAFAGLALTVVRFTRVYNYLCLYICWLQILLLEVVNAICLT